MADTEDPIVLYLVVRTSLNMSTGKIAAQCSHGVEKMLVHYFLAMAYKAKLHNDGKFPQEEADHIKMTTEWRGKKSRKVILAANEEEWNAVKQEYGKQCEIVRDAGLTELEPGTDTVICLWPQYKAESSKTIKSLKAL